MKTEIEKLYPIVKMAKTSLGRKLEENEQYVKLYYCPICNKRLSGKKVDYNNYWVKLRKSKVKPTYGEDGGNLIHPLPIKV